MRALANQLVARAPAELRGRRVLVLEFTTSEGALCGLSAPVVEELSTRLASAAAFSVLERRFAASSAEAIIVGTIEPLADSYALRCRLILVGSGRIASVADIEIDRASVEEHGLCRGHSVAAARQE